MTPATDNTGIVLVVILLVGSAFMLGFVVAKMTEPPVVNSTVHYPELPEDPVEFPGHDGPSDRALDCSKPGAGRPWC